MLKPLPGSKWNFRTAAHLLNRAGFGGTPSEIERLVELGPDRAVAQFVDYEKVEDPTPDPEWAKPDPDRVERQKEYRDLARQLNQASTPEERAKLEQKRRELRRQETRNQQQQVLELRQWWLGRMANGPRPLQEKLTLFWHGHFATSVQKVRDPYFMWRQNETFRQHAAGSWLEMLEEVTQDPAMLIWLDQAQSRKTHPNENYAREVMELFALGEGHYTEKDILEAARAFTGLSLDRVQQKPVYRPVLHDNGVKTVLGRTANLGWKDVLEGIVAQPQAARFITAKLWSFFAAENPKPELIAALADEFKRNDNQFKPVLQRIFRSEEFYAEEVIRTQVKSPVQWLVSSVRMLERPLPPPAATTGALRQLGQDLFAPPNVKGWDGGVSWITTNNLLNRYNYGATLVMGREALPMIARGDRAARMRDRLNRARREIAPPVDVRKLFASEELSDKRRLVPALARRFLQDHFRPKQAEAIRAYLDSEPELTEGVARNAIRLVMSSPDFQLS